jgi:hypothetical protein
MITALKTPAASSVMLDGNNTNIIIQSTNGAGYYFRAEIYINGILFDTQGWSRIDGHTAVTDLKKLYYAYFKPVFVPAFVNGLIQQTHLMGQVSIVIKEYALGNATAVVQSITLPLFTMHYNVRPVEFNHIAALRLLGMDSPYMVVPVTGKIVVPVYVNSATPQTVKVTLTTSAGTEVHAATIANAQGKKVYLYQFDLAGASLSYNVTHLVATVAIGTSINTLNVTYRINRLPNFAVKEIAFQNNFGYYLYAYPDGEMEVVNNISPATYETTQGDQLSEIDEEATYAINTGSYKVNEKAILTMVANSLDTRLKNGSAWLRIITQTKKITTFRDKLHQYSAELLFKLRLGNDVENTGMIVNASALPSIYIDTHKVVGNQVSIFFEYNNGYVPTQLRLQVRATNSSTWSSIPVAVVSPAVINITSGERYMRLQDFNNQDIVSNQIIVTVI